MIKPEYHRWIDDYRGRYNGRVTHKCAAATAEMVEAFPELRVERGFVLAREEDRVDLPTPDMCLEARRSVYHLDVGLFQHFWCVTAEGEVVDPTRAQFRPGLEPIYVAYDMVQHGPLPSGKCPDCGEIVFPEQRGFCDKTCEARWEKYMKEEETRRA